MPTFLQNLQDKFRQFKDSGSFTKKNVLTLLLLFIIGLSLFPGIKLVQDSQILKSRAEEDDSCPEPPEFDQCGANPLSCDNVPTGFADEHTVHIRCTVSEDGTVHYNCEGKGVIAGQCGNPEPPTPPPPSTSPSTPPASTAPGASLPPGTQCNISSKQNPSLSDACVSCIVNNNGGSEGLIRGIRGSCSVSNVGKSDKEMVNYWCNGGLGSGASSDCLTKKAACGTACGATPVFSPSPSATTQVSPSPATTINNATCGTFTAPATVNVGQSFNVSLTMNNPAGAKAWNTTSLYRLGKVDNSANNVWILPEINGDRVSLPSTPINPGSSANFSFQVTAPATPGTKTLELRMVQDGVEWFGGVCSKSINITSSSPSPSPSSSARSSTSPSPSSSTTLTCDFNKDGVYDDKDFKIWVDEFTGQKRTLKADCAGNPDGSPDLKVDLVDFNKWRDEKINRE